MPFCCGKKADPSQSKIEVGKLSKKAKGPVSKKEEKKTTPKDTKSSAQSKLLFESDIPFLDELQVSAAKDKKLKFVENQKFDNDSIYTGYVRKDDGVR